MKLVFTGRTGASLCDWESFALLRDNVQHFVEGGVRSGRFSALHGIATAVDGESCAVDAVRLRVEVLQASRALWLIPVQSAAVSTRTRAVRQGRAVPRSSSVTSSPAADSDLQPFAEDWSEPVPKAARAFVAAVLSLTQAAVAGDVLEVRCTPSAPRVATGP